MSKDPFLVPWRRPAPFHDDEDISSLVIRMARYSGMSNYDFFYKYLDARGFDIGKAGAVIMPMRRLSVISGQPLRKLLSNGFAGTVEKPNRNSWGKYRFRGHTFPNAWIAHKKRVAPGVLASAGDDPYVKVAWRFLWMPCDPCSGEALIDGCPRCHRSLHWPDKSLHTCEYCRFDLRQARAIYMPDHVVEATRLFAGAIGLGETGREKRIRLPVPFQNLSIEEQIAVTSWCALLSGQLDRTRRPADVVNAAGGLAMAMRWPQPLMEAVDLLARQSGTVEEVPGAVNAIFGSWKVPVSVKDAVMAQANHLLNARLRREPPSGSKTLPLPTYVIVD